MCVMYNRMDQKQDDPLSLPQMVLGIPQELHYGWSSRPPLPGRRTVLADGLWRYRNSCTTDVNDVDTRA